MIHNHKSHEKKENWMITHEKNSTPIQKLELYSCYSLIFKKKERKKYLFFSSAHMGEMFFSPVCQEHAQSCSKVI